MVPPKQITITLNVDENYLDDLKRRLEKYGVSQRQLAREAGYEDTDISRMFRDGISPRLEKVVKLETAILEIRKRMAADKGK